jgi:hypothetical protein
MYEQVHRSNRDVWVASAGAVQVNIADNGGVKIVVSNATMIPDPMGGDYESAATGNFEVTAEGQVSPKSAN